MPSFHIPDLDSIQDIADPANRFYAVVGALMSLNGALERLEFQIFHKGSGTTEEMAGAIFYPVLNDSARTAMALNAMKLRLQSDVARTAEWSALMSRFGDGEVKAARNLVSHNPAVREMRASLLDSYLAC